MTYYELLRARKVFVRFALVLAAIAVLVVAAKIFGAHGSVVVDRGGTSHVYNPLDAIGIVSVPMAALIGLAAYAGIGVATALATGLNLETGHAHLTFVRPESRTRMALEMIAVDCATIAASALATFFVALLAVWIVLGAHARYLWSGSEPVVAALALGVGFMWYAILQAVTAWAPPRSGSYAVVAAIALVLAVPLAHAPFLGPIASLFGLVLYVDPFAYLTSVSSGDAAGATIGSLLGGGTALRALAAWLLACGFLALATFEWRRVEV